MVCSLGSGRMAAISRLLATRSFSQTTAEEIGHQKLAAQYIQRELREADEANLLDEEDMHVFGLKPMADPLQLVCCNACKKPVTTSQYAAHAELCRLLNSTEQSPSELGGGTGHKKPPKKERKKLLTAHANRASTAGEQERSESADADDTAASVCHLDEQIGMTSVFIGPKGTSICVDTAPVMDDSGVSPGNKDYLAGVMPPSTKRSKLIAAECLPLSDDLETACGVTKITCISRLEAATCREFPKASIAGSGKPYDHDIGHQKPGQVHGHCLPSEDVPAPLATKMYYSQRNHRLRSAYSRLFYETLAKEHCSELVGSKVLQGTMMPSQASSPKDLSQEQMGDHPEKKRDTHSLPSMRSPDKILAQSSEVCLGKPGGCSPDVNFSNHFAVNNVLRPHTVSVEMMRSKYLSKPYSFAGNSGVPLVTMQQPNGSVPVT